MENKTGADPEGDPSTGSSPASQGESGGWLQLWDRLVRLGYGEPVLRAGTYLLSLLLFVVVIWVMSTFYVHGPARIQPAVAFSGLQTTPTSDFLPPQSDFSKLDGLSAGISRQAVLHTNVSDQPRFDIIQYTVQPGDSLFGIADQFHLKPQTILWGNYAVLADDPERLVPDQQLNILPVDGVLYQWRTGDGLNGVAKFFGVSADDIIDWPTNHLNRANLGTLSNPNIPDKTFLVIPGGTREFSSWSAPRVVRTDPGAAKGIGAGVCSTVSDGAIGTGTYIWPTTEHFISGYNYSPETNHPAIDIGGKLGNPVYTADNGVVVYSGWSDLGYGNMVMIDHGNGWQSLYAHLSAINVSCGQSLYQGAQIGLMGSTGNSSGPHLHFELRSDKLGKVNPLKYLP
ncbi:MAG TPA: M23 family metallopeptidase [Anaerolineaceae bacterium]|jgi:murein DD-endopeptidase MepM/ murein hydrolase activator NlpD